MKIAEHRDAEEKIQKPFRNEIFNEPNNQMVHFMMMIYGDAPNVHEAGDFMNE